MLDIVNKIITIVRTLVKKILNPVDKTNTIVPTPAKLPNPVDNINAIVEHINNVCIPHQLNSYNEEPYDGVLVVLAHWDYENHCAKKYQGIKWIFDHWRKLSEQGESTAFKVYSEKVCILSFESEEKICSIDDQDIEDKRKENMIYSIRMLMALETVTYIQTPPGKLKHIKKTVQELSKISFLQRDDSKNIIEYYLKKMNSYQALETYLHNVSSECDASSLGEFNKIINNMSNNMKEELEGILTDFQSALERCIENDNPASCLKENDAYMALAEKVREGWFYQSAYLHGKVKMTIH